MLMKKQSNKLNSLEKLGSGGNKVVIFILEEVKLTIFDFSEETVSLL